jgi:formate dehydrogenase subunit gamma
VTLLDPIVRYNLQERLVHWASAVSYVYLLLTGLAFWTPALYWLAIVLGGGYLSRLLHPWVGLIFTGAVLVMWATWRREMKAAPEDIAWRKAIVHYLKNEDAHVPPVGRFNYGQKQFFWLMAVTGAALLLSGLVLWSIASVPFELRWLRYTAILVHSISALLTIAGIIVHIYMGIAVVPGGLAAIVHGEVTPDWARHHHPLWHSKMTGGGEPPPVE